MRDAPHLPHLSYLYNPYEIAICGYSGGGKTHLIERLLASLTPDLVMGYVKHRAHAFHMDRPGKDTDRARQAGASLVSIADGHHQALIDACEGASLASDLRYLRCDAVIVEGGKDLSMPQIVVVDADKKILDDLPRGAIALCGQEPLEHALPWYHRDAIADLRSLILDRWAQEAAAQPILGLILAGGRSQRMGLDKGVLQYHQHPQISHLAKLLAPFSRQVAISARPGQYEAESGLPLLEDQFLDMGPLGGLLTAHRRYPTHALLSLACDMPNIDATFLTALLRERSPLRLATVPRGEAGLEPLAAIYEPKFFRFAWEALGRGEVSPQGLLQRHRIHSFVPELKNALVNVNLPADREAWLRHREGRDHGDEGLTRESV